MNTWTRTIALSMALLSACSSNAMPADATGSDASDTVVARDVNTMDNAINDVVTQDIARTDIVVTDQNNSDVLGSDSSAVDAPQDAAITDANGNDVVVVADAADAIVVDVSLGDAGRVPENHRPNDLQCETSAPAGTCNGGGGTLNGCHSDNDCSDAGPNGRCNRSTRGVFGCFCTSDACIVDSDCATGETCACHGSAFVVGGNTCVPGNCRVDSDCGANGYCSPSHGNTGCGNVTGYYCRTPNDLCVDDSDCANSTGLQVCAYSTDNNRWECANQRFCP